MSKLTTILSALLVASADVDGSCLLTLRSDLATENQSPDAMTWAERHKLLLAWTKDHAAVSAAAARARERTDRMSAKQPAGLMAGGSLDMEDFINQQKRSSDSCYAKHLEVKRTLDGLHQKVDILSNEVKSNDAIILAHTAITMEKNDEKMAADEKHKNDLEECKNILDADQAEVDQFQKEIDELTNIANPDVRSKIKFQTNMTDQVQDRVKKLTEEWEANNQGHLSEEDHQKILDEALGGSGTRTTAAGEPCVRASDCESNYCAGGMCCYSSAEGGNCAQCVSGSGYCETCEDGYLWKEGVGCTLNGEFLQTAAVEEHAVHDAKTSALAALNNTIAKMDLTQCKKAAEFLQASTRVKSKITSIATIEDCDAQRQALQDEFADAYLQITHLRDSTAVRIEEAHEDCVAMADGARDEAQERLDTTIQESTTAMNRAQEIIQALNPLLIDAKKALAKVEDHLTELEGSCAKEDDVSEHLQRVRDLIMSLEKCPGRHDFTLEMPASATAVL